MLEACYGMLELNGGNDRFALYFDEETKTIYECDLAENYTYSNFLDELKANQLIDLLLMLEEAEDKSPALDHISAEAFDELASFQFYLPDSGLNEAMDILGIAWLVDGTLLSLHTHERWEGNKISIARWNEAEKREEQYFLNNISSVENGVGLRNEIKALTELTIENLCPQCMYTEMFRRWCCQLDANNRHRVYKKIQLAAQRRFTGGEPLFKTLENGEGMRELRFSAYPGGAIRILFGDLPADGKAIILGFIKKKDKDGYKANMKRAKDLWKKM